MDILRMFDVAFQDVCKHPQKRLFPEDKEKETQDLNQFIYPTVNNGVYRCGFARTQEAYQIAHRELFASLDRLEEHLARGGDKFLTGPDFTWIDLRLYQTLVR